MDYVENELNDYIINEQDFSFFMLLNQIEHCENYEDKFYIKLLKTSVISSNLEIVEFLNEKIVEKKMFTMDLLKSIVYLFDECSINKEILKILTNLMKKVIEKFQQYYSI